MRVGTSRDTQAGVGEGHSAAKQREERRGEEKGDWTVSGGAEGQNKTQGKSSEGAPGGTSRGAPREESTG